MKKLYLRFNFNIFFSKKIRFLFGKNKVISLAFGRSVESEYKDNLFKITPHLSGNIGLLFTNKSKEEVLKYYTIILYLWFGDFVSIIEF